MTGGAKGIGEGIVKVLAGEGAIPVIVGRSESDNNKVVTEVERVGVRPFRLKLTYGSCGSRKAAEAVMKKFGRIEGLVNNAVVNDGVGLENGNYENSWLHFIKTLFITISWRNMFCPN